jgi:hypothetical protein
MFKLVAMRHLLALGAATAIVAWFGMPYFDSLLSVWSRVRTENRALELAHELQILMEKTHLIRHDDAKVRDEFAGRSAMPWFDEGVFNPAGSELLGHSGGRCGCNSFVGFDLKQHVGVVVLTNQSNIHSSMLGWRMLQHARLNGVNPVTMAPLREINGAGVALDIDPQSSLPRVTKVFVNSPAQKAGLTVGRIIHSINGVPTANKNLAECVEMVRGKSGTLLKLELADAGQNQTESIELLREKFLLDD